MRDLIFSVLLLAGCASATADAPQDETANPETVIAAERAFAARAGQVGWIPAFREFTAPDGELGRPDGFVNAAQALADAPDDGNRALFWWPAIAAISRSGDMGFTAGPVSFDAARAPRIQYFTVWRRQPDGSWKWIYDGGVGPVPDVNYIAADATSVPMLAVAASGVGSAATAVAQVSAIEREATSPSALAVRLAPDAQVYRTRHARTLNASDGAAAMAIPSADASYQTQRTEGSAAGDMVMSTGEARWAEQGQARTGYFARVWQHRADGWRIVYDQMILPRPAPPPG